jgi:ribosome-associated protein
MLPLDGKPISKSRIKRELLAVQELGKVLVDLPEKHLVKIPVSAHLREAIQAARELKRGARQRQIRYIGALLSDEGVEPIRLALEETLRPDRDAVEQFHQVEQWRDKLLSGGDEAINEILSLTPSADRQKLRRLVRTALQEKVADKPPRTNRLLFAYLRDLLNPVA